MAGSAPTRGHGGARAFASLGRWIVRHPWYPVAFWVALLVVTVPFLPLLGSVTTNSTDSTPSGAPSAIAAARLAQLFPNGSGGSAETVLLYGPDLTDLHAQRVVENVTAAIAADRSLSDVASVESIYTEFTSYLAGQVELASGVLAPALTGSPSLPDSVNATEAVLWAPPVTFLATWEALSANHSRSPAGWDLPAYNQTAANVTGPALASLREFYAEFNGSFACATLTPYANVEHCADLAVRAGARGNLATLLPDPALGADVLAGMAVENASRGWNVTRAVGSVYLGNESGLPGTWIETVWIGFPSGVVSPAAAALYAEANVSAHTLAHESLPVPVGMYAQFVNRAGTASIVQVSFSVADDYTNGSGGDPVYADLPTIASLAASTVRASDPSDAIAVATTGPAPLDALSQEAVNSSLSLVLPLTVGLLLVISMLYFRSPLTPMVTFAGLAIALLLGLGATVLVGTLIEHVDSSALTLEEVFVLGVGTDYSIFLVARYREELVAGAASHDAIVTSMRWAGQSVATSGSTAILVTLALALSGVALLSQWGMVLSFAILITMLMSLTLVPAALALIGPRIFWPTTGARFERRAAVVSGRLERKSTYFYRAGRFSERRAGVVVGAIVLVSVPLVALALSVPISYDYYGQLPSGHPATEGLAELNSQFGPGFATPSYALVTFTTPLLVGNVTDASDFLTLANLTEIANGTPGIASVGSPVGPTGASIADWLDLASLPPALRTNLIGLLAGYVGTDGRTVLLSLETTSTGLSTTAVAAVDSVESSFSAYAAAHPGVTEIVYGGAAPVIRDLADETNLATEYMILAVTIGLIAVLVVVLRSWIIALMAVATIGLSIGWAWAITYLVLDRWIGFPLFFYVRTILFVLVLGLGIDYNIFLLTRVREERLKGRPSGTAAVEAVARTGGIITAAAIILASAFGALIVAEFTLIRAIGFAVAVAVILDAMVVRTYLVPASLQLLGDRVWSLSGRKHPPAAAAAPTGPDAANPPATP
ncbi:MAG TPA: MMPL family transporter [Thermoplasmata archaeon]|nr:MMPL family transporter [Thermoplasmata archaeon]